jgi:hypothetical protein
LEYLLLLLEWTRIWLPRLSIATLIFIYKISKKAGSITEVSILLELTDMEEVYIISITTIFKVLIILSHFIGVKCEGEWIVQ